MYRLEFLVVAAMLASAMSSTAQAQMTIDMKTMTCEQLLQGGPNSVEGAIWLSGYYNGLSQKK